MKIVNVRFYAAVFGTAAATQHSLPIDVDISLSMSAQMNAKHYNVKQLPYYPRVFYHYQGQTVDEVSTKELTH